MSKMVIAGHDVHMGKTSRIELQVARLPTNTYINIPLVIHRSKKDGPTLLLLAGMHGDEINGVETLRRMLVNKLTIPESGTVIVVPILNVFGFLHSSRTVPDGRDLNRSFPGKKKGSLASRIAYHFIQEVFSHIDYGIDLHTGGARRSNYPQIRCDIDDPKQMEIAMAFTAKMIVHSKQRTGSLRSFANKKNIPFLIYEAGETLRLDELAIAEAIQGIQRVMYTLGMLSSCPPSTKPVIVRKRRWIRATRSGLFQSFVELGQIVEHHSDIGMITDPFGTVRTRVKAPYRGVVIACNNNPVVSQGDALIHLGNADS